MTIFGGSAAAQDNSDANAAAADLRLAGVVRTAGGAVVPGSTLRVIQIASGKAWVSWTDENGKFEFPALSAGHYRVEISQLGFAPATKEIDLASGAQSPLELQLEVESLAAITSAAASESAATTPKAPAKSAPSGTPANDASVGSQNSAASGNAGSPSGRPGGAGGAQSGGAAGARNGPGGGYGGPGQGGGRRAFQQVGLNALNQISGENTGEDLGAPDSGSQLGQAASADAVQMIGTVAMGQMQNPTGGVPQLGDGGPGGPDGQGAFGNGGNAIPGQSAPGYNATGGPGGGFGGGPGGGAVMVMRGGGGGGRGPAGPGGGPAGIDALWGAQRVMRQRINR